MSEEAMKVWRDGCGAYEDAYEAAPGPVGARSRVIAGDQADAAVIAAAMKCRAALKP